MYRRTRRNGRKDDTKRSTREQGKGKKSRAKLRRRSCFPSRHSLFSSAVALPRRQILFVPSRRELPFAAQPQILDFSSPQGLIPRETERSLRDVNSRDISGLQVNHQLITFSRFRPSAALRPCARSAEGDSVNRVISLRKRSV